MLFLDDHLIIVSVHLLKAEGSAIRNAVSCKFNIDTRKSACNA
ncbi:hypothetical protein SynBIOSU31_01405 [Synechococcus sp. BIOS-U3-1]|nr:hypothetical protein SynBIOSU31_01405 [Synechococcus sp. BIOS-U3-1]